MDVLPAALLDNASLTEKANSTFESASTASYTPASISKAYLVAASGAIVPEV